MMIWCVGIALDAVILPLAGQICMKERLFQGMRVLGIHKWSHRASCRVGAPLFASLMSRGGRMELYADGK